MAELRTKKLEKMANALNTATTMNDNFFKIITIDLFIYFEQDGHDEQAFLKLKAFGKEVVVDIHLNR